MKIMKRFLISLVLVISFFGCFNCYAGDNTLKYTMKTNYMLGEENGEIFNYMLVLNDNKFNLVLYHFLPYKVGEYGYKEEIGIVPKNCNMLIKFSDGEVIDLKCVNVVPPYYGLSDYSYRLMSFTNITNEIIEKLATKDVIKIRVSTDIKYIDLSTNIFKYIKEGVNSLNNQKNIKNNSNMYEGF